MEHSTGKHKVVIGGDIICLMLCKKTCLFMELNAFPALFSKTASVSFVANISCIEYTAALHPVLCPPHSCEFQTAFFTPPFIIIMTSFPAIL